MSRARNVSRVVALLGVAGSCLVLATASAHAAVLYDQLDNGGGGSVRSQDLNNNGAFDAGYGEDSQAADDFVVPSGQTWKLTGVDVPGDYGVHGSSAAGPAQSVDVFIYSGSTPAGQTPIASLTGQAHTDVAGTFNITLSTPQTLFEGTYWLSVWVHQNQSTNGDWGWEQRTVVSGNRALAYANACDFSNTPKWHFVNECGGSGPDLRFRLNGVVRDALTVSKLGDGEGTVTSQPAGINLPAGGVHSELSRFDDGSQVTLTASSRASDSVFSGWTVCDHPSGATCVMDMNAHAKQAKATFDVASPLTFRKTGAGDGTVSSDDGRMSCDPGCAKTNSVLYRFALGTHPTITALSDSNSVFTGWTGCDHPSANTCVMDQVSTDAGKKLYADFAAAQGIILRKTGAGNGTLDSNVPAIHCTLDTCKTNSAYFRAALGTTLDLVPTPDPSSVFVGWSGCDKVIGTTCEQQMTGGSAKQAFAEFAVGRKLSVVVSGAAGTVSSTPAGIHCGSSCSRLFADGDPVRLTAHPGPNSEFAGWSTTTGSCPSYDACTVFMQGPVGVVAHFIARPDGGGERPKPLQTTVTGKSVNPNGHAATFQFKGTGGLGKITFECKLDNASFSACRSPKRYTKLKKGRHVFHVRAKDSKGAYDQTPPTVPFTI